MNSVHWVVQRNLGSAEDVAKLCAYLDRLAVPWTPLTVIPFDDTPPAVPTEGRVLFYGSTTLMRNVTRAGLWSPGVYFDDARFSFEALREGYGAALLNGASEVTTLRALSQRVLDPGDEFFARPTDDLKTFAGQVFSVAELLVWAHELAAAQGLLTLDTRVQLAPVVRLGREWRTVVVDGRVVAASQYRSSGRYKVSDDVPPEALDFARAMAARYAPAPVFMLDVCETDEGLRVVETNCFNSAGFYWCDLYEVVRSVTAYAASR